MIKSFSLSTFFYRVILLLAVIATSVSSGTAASLQPASVPKNIKFEVVVSGLNDPVLVTHAGDGSNRLFIVERGGLIRIHKNGVLNAIPFLDVSGLISQDGGEQGLLGLAFDPNYETSGKFYIVYTNADWSVVLARYTVSPDLDIANVSGTVLLTIPRNDPLNKYSNHNGGMLAFSPDGYLYMSVGDGGGPRDPFNNGQRLDVLMGKILRLDVSGLTYSIPPTNPFFNNYDPTIKQEIWSYGLRNPWRFSFDSLNGDMYIGDVGAATQEEVNFQSTGASGGQNYGWDIMEGNTCHLTATCTPPENYAAPVAVYEHGVDDEIGCSVIGGYVYRGSSFAALQGVYLYADFCLGKIWGLKRNASNQWTSTLIADTDYLITSFGEDEQGELYFFNYSGGYLYRIAEATILSETYTSDASHDGIVIESAEHSGIGSAITSKQVVLPSGDDANDRQFRTILSFNTANLPNNAKILSVTLNMRQGNIIGDNPFLTHGKLLVELGNPTFGSGLALESVDFHSPSNGAAATFKATPVNNWYSAKFNAVSLAKINLMGFTQLRLRFMVDDNDDLSRDTVQLISGNHLNANARPILIITYFIP